MTVQRIHRALLAGSHAVAFLAGLAAGALLMSRQPNTSAPPPSPIAAPPDRVSPTGHVVRKAPHNEAVAPVEDLLALLQGGRVPLARALTNIENNWHPSHAAMLVELLHFTPDPIVAEGIVDLLQRKTNEHFAGDLDGWFRFIWSQPYAPHPGYSEFKARLYEQIDPRFREYFLDNAPTKIRLDEIRWGGVRRDGIPPLKNPATLAAAGAAYLADTDVVFGIQINGESRAYPQRILAWHEMVKDTVGGESINGVYCTLCGSMIVYRTRAEDGTHYELGTSGFLYRSNKLMYDHGTKSLWSTIDGEPVVGPLMGKGIKLQPLSVVTTTWGQWRADHPETRVLSLDTGHRRDYGEGVAYREYFATDELMFAVPQTDERLRNKADVFIVRAGDGNRQPLAIAVDFLRQNPVYHDRLGATTLVVITDGTAANRAYDAGTTMLVGLSESGAVVDEDGSEWIVTEDALVRRDGEKRLPRLPAHRAFWFGWYSAQPQTRLVK